MPKFNEYVVWRGRVHSGDGSSRGGSEGLSSGEACHYYSDDLDILIYHIIRDARVLQLFTDANWAFRDVFGLIGEGPGSGSF